MTDTQWNDRDEDRDNPHRLTERRRVREELEARLVERDVDLTGTENDDEIVAMIDAVEAFEARRAQLGGDSFTNTMMSSDPDDEDLVLPQRRDDESVEHWVRRVREKTEALGG